MSIETGDIIDQIKKGSQPAFKLLVETHQQYAYSLAFRILCNEEEARDAVQESFIKIWRKINTYDRKAKFSTWMYRIITNTAIDHLRVIKRVKFIQLDEVSEKLENLIEIGPAAQLDNKELGQLIRYISEGLPKKQKLVFILRDIQEMGSVEVQQILAMSETVVKSNLYHARQGVRDKRPASNGHPGTISLVYKLLLAATVCLLMVFGVEQYLFVDKVQKLEDRASSITKEHTKKPGFKIIFSLNTGIKFEYVETLLKPDESKIFKKGIKTRLKIARLSALDVRGLNLKGLKQLNNMRMNPDQQHSGSFN